MKLNKEYPATHSMSTAWYVADEEGNVGIFNFDDNGPVPEQAVSESCIDELLFGLESDYTKYKATQINLSDQQLEELLTSPHLPEEEKYWWDCVVQIDQSKVTDYMEMVSQEEKFTNICLSRNRCLFKADFHKCLDKEQIQNGSLLHNLIDKGIITQVFNIKSFWLDEIIDEEEDIDIENIIGQVPYYIYWEPYSTSSPQKRLNKPLHPVKLNQIPAGLREHIPILPVLFAEKKALQIAEWTPCYWNCYNIEVVDGFYYDLKFRKLVSMIL